MITFWDNFRPVIDCILNSHRNLVLLLELVSNILFRPIRYPYFLNFYFMKTADIPVHGNIVAYEIIAMSVY